MTDETKTPHLAAARRRESGEMLSRDTSTGERARDTASSCSWDNAQGDHCSAQQDGIQRRSEQPSESSGVGRTISDWEQRKRAKLKKAALEENASYSRWLSTNVPAALRTRFPHLFNSGATSSHDPPLLFKDTG